MANVVPFESKALPAFLSKAAGPINDDLTSHVGNGMTSLSIKGKVFTLVKGKERTVIMKPDDADEVASSLEIVIIKANKDLSKVWYAKAFEDGVDAKPDCMSNDGVRPDPQVANPQAKSCAVCAKNVWGSGKEGKGKACQDSRRVAVAAAGQLNEPMLLRVPPASLKSLAEYGKTLSNRGVPYSAVVTKLRFDREEATPKLVFSPVGFLDEAQFEEVQKLANSELVNQIVGVLPVTDDEALEQAPAKATPAPKAKVEPKKVEAVADDELDAALAPAKEVIEKAAAKPKTKVESIEEDLDSLLSELDD